MRPEERRKIKEQMNLEKSEVDLTWQEIQQAKDRLSELRREQRAVDRGINYQSMSKGKAGESGDYETARSYAGGVSRLMKESNELGGKISRVQAELGRLQEQHNQAIARYRQLRDQLSGS